MAFGFLKKPINWLTGQTDFHADAPGTGPGQRAIRAQMNQIASRGRSQAQSMAAGARGSSSPLALREAQRQAAFANQAAAQQGAVASGQLEQQRLQNIMQQQQINAETARGNAGGIQKLAGLAIGGAALLSDDRSKNVQGGYFDARTKMDAQATADEARRKQGMLGLASYMQGNSDSPFAVSDEKAKNLEAENAALRSRLGAVKGIGGSAAASLAFGPGAALFAAPAIAGMARPKGMNHTPAPAGPAPLQTQETPALAPTEAQALAIVRAREEAKAKALARDLAASTEAQAAAANERQQIAAIPGSDSRQAELGRRLSDDRTKMYSDEDMKGGMGHGRMQFPEGVEPITFTYKPEAQAAFGLDGDVNVGLKAQDLEKSPEGATVVEEDPMSGMKMVDTQKLTMLATAKLAEMEDRLKKLEGGKRGK